MQLVADALLVGAGRGDQEVQRLFTGIAGAFGQDIIQLAVWLGMDFIQNKAGHIQAVFRAYLCGKHLIKPGVAVVDDAFGRRHDLAPLEQCRGHLHHLVGHIENDGRLLAVGGSTVDFGRRFIICKQQIQRNGGCKLALSILLADLHICRAELAVSVLIHDAEHIPDDLLLPRQKPEPLARPLALGVAQVFNECHRPVCFCLIVVGSRQHEP